MRVLYKNFLKQECNKHIKRYFDYLRTLNSDVARISERTGTTVNKKMKRPSYWYVYDHFNPFKVKPEKKLQTYSYTITKRIAELSYEPMSALTNRIPKDDGSFRKTNVFSLPDAALSRLIYKSLLHKNINRFIASSYAYREDRDSHDSILEISLEWSRLRRIFVAEYDFSKFFDNIEHEYIWEVIDRYKILITGEERYVVNKFLKSKTCDAKSYSPAGGKERSVGVPQGTSISLFLANIACWELDRELAKLGVSFSRYADDIVIWDRDYAKVVQGYELIASFGERMGVPINIGKSEGISLVSEKKGEIFTKSSIKYLGYKISLDCVSINDNSTKKIQKKISWIIYQNLLQPLKRDIFNPSRLSGLDWDYVVAIGQIRSYLYGGLNYRQLRQFIAGASKKLNFRGLMSYYPVVNDERQLKELDGWLLYSLKQSLRLRQRLWQNHSGQNLPGSKLNWIEGLEGLASWQSPTGKRYDLRVPSFLLINKAIRKGIEQSGLRSVANPNLSYY